MLLLTCDSIRTERSVSNAIRNNISKKTGVPIENILYSSTHSHNTPDPVNGSYSTLLRKSALESALAAMEDRNPATMYCGVTYTDKLNFVRHYIMSDGSITGTDYDYNAGLDFVSHATEVDNQVQLIQLMRENAKDILMMNWRAHPIADKAGYCYISAGYIGFCRKNIEEQTDLHFAYFQGASGNVADATRIGSEKTFTTVKEQGKMLADTVIKALPNLEEVKTGLIESKVVTYKGNVRRDPPELALACATFTTVLDNGGTVLDAQKATNYMVRSKWVATGVNARLKLHRISNSKFDLELYALSVGNVAFIGSPNELFDNTGVQIKDASTYEQTFILCYCNGRGNYMPSEPAYTYGCYEKDRATLSKAQRRNWLRYTPIC